MKVHAALLCLAVIPGLVSCTIGYSHKQYTSTRTTSTVNDEEYTKTVMKDNRREECSYSFKTKGYGYTFKSNGTIKVSNGIVEKLRDGQFIDVVITEGEREYPYTITNGVTGIRISVPEGTLTETDEVRIRRAMERVEKQIAGNLDQTQSTKRQMEAAQKQLKATEAQMQREVKALQRQTEAFQRQMQKQAEAMQKQAEVLQKQAEDLQRRMAE